MTSQTSYTNDLTVPLGHVRENVRAASDRVEAIVAAGSVRRQAGSALTVPERAGSR